MRPRFYVCEYRALEVATSDAAVVEEDVKAVVCQILVNCEFPRYVGAAIIEKQALLDKFQILDDCPSRVMQN